MIEEIGRGVVSRKRASLPDVTDLISNLLGDFINASISHHNALRDNIVRLTL